MSRQSFGRTSNETKHMMQADSPLIVPPGGGKATDVIGNAITIKIHGRDNGGAFSLVQSVDKPNIGPPPHVHHREDEAFYVLAGEYEFGCGGERIRAKEGTTIFRAARRAASLQMRQPDAGPVARRHQPGGHRAILRGGERLGRREASHRHWQEIRIGVSAGDYFNRYFTWYDTEHYHSGIDYVTPQQAHQGLRQKIVAQRRGKKPSQRRRRREENQKRKTGRRKTNNQIIMTASLVA